MSTDNPIGIVVDRSEAFAVPTWTCLKTDRCGGSSMEGTGRHLGDAGFIAKLETAFMKATDPEI